jgi:hypothetical protein
VSTSTISFWQADQNWSIQQRIWTLSSNSPAKWGAAAPANASSGVASADQIALMRITEPLKSAAMSALELSSSSMSGYTSNVATPGTLVNFSA